MAAARSTVAPIAAGGRRGALAAGTACAGVCALVLLAPFEALTPLVRVPAPAATSGGSPGLLMAVTSSEAALIAVLGAWIAVLAFTGSSPRWRTLLTWPWLALVAAMGVAALASPVDRVNGAHMAARLALAGAVFLAAVNGTSTNGHRHAVLVAAATAAGLVGLLVLADYADLRLVRAFLARFRAGEAVVGGQMRASGPFQYPTIASMYLEVLFALSLPLLLLAIDARRRWRAAVIGAVLLLAAQAIAWTFTRAGLVSIVSSLAIVGALRYRTRGADRGVAALALLAALAAVQFISSWSYELLHLRLTTETTGAWYRASVDAPRQLALGAGRTVSVPVTVTNAGRRTWDPAANPPFAFSYHWLLADSDRVVSWEGLRTEFAAPVAPGESVAIAARVEAPRQPGQYRLMWDIEQHERLWFSTEPDAPLLVTDATVTGPAVGPATDGELRPLPRRATRPGRFELWGAALRMAAAHPVTGVGPDNFRLVYGEYAGMASFDRRVHSNNMYLETLAGGGLLALVALAWFCRRGAGALRRLLRPEAGMVPAGIAAAVIAIALHGIFDAFLSFTATYVLIAVALGLAVAAAEVKTPHADRV